MKSDAIERSGRTRRDLVADVDHDVFVVAAEHSNHLLDGAAVTRSRTLEIGRSGQQLEARLVLDDEIAQELRVEPMHVVERIEQRVAAAQPEKQRHFAETGLEVDDQRRPYW